jgi:hypothetical protein
MLLVVCPSQGFKGDRTSALHCACACALYYRFSVGKAAVAGIAIVAIKDTIMVDLGAPPPTMDEDGPLDYE